MVADKHAGTAMVDGARDGAAQGTVGCSYDGHLIQILGVKGAFQKRMSETTSNVGHGQDRENDC